MKKSILSLLIASAFLAGCSNVPAAPETQTQSASSIVLTDYQWALTQAQNADGQKIQEAFAENEKPLTLVFSDEGVSVLNACNVMQAAYQAQNNQMIFSEMIATRKMCQPALNKLESFISQQMRHAAQYTVSSEEKPTLTMTFDDGRVLTFTGTPTLRKQHAGEREDVIFLEIAEPNVCTPNACLKAREIIYNEDGTVKSRGAWKAFKQPIEGYEHQKGTIEVLRLKRFTPQTGDEVTYVLDLIVSTQSD